MPYLAPQGPDRDGTDVVAVDRDAPIGHVVKSGNQIDQRRLAAAAHAYEGDNFPGPDVQVDVFQDGCFLIPEIHIADGDALRYPRQLNGGVVVPDVRYGVDDGENPLRPGDTLLNGVVHVGQAFYRFVKQDEGRQKREEPSGGEAAADDLKAAVKDDDADGTSA